MRRELQTDRQDRPHFKNTARRPLLRQRLEGIRARRQEEQRRRQNTADRHLGITLLHTVQIQRRQHVGRDQT